MYKIARIVFNPINKEDDNIIDVVDDILAMLIKNGQILDECVVENHKEFFIANVITTDDDSLDEKYYNKYILDAIKYFNIEVEIISDDALAVDSCHCENHSYYILAIDPNCSSSPIICGDCGKEMPLTKIPYLFNEEEHYSILSFQEIYKAVDTLWMNSLSDSFTRRQISDYKSQLNQRGIDVCFELEKKVNKPVYYLLCNPIGGWNEFNKNKNLNCCPKCGNELSELKDSYVDKVCNNCRLAFIVNDENN